MADGRNKYMCALCGALLSSGMYCKSCYNEINNDFSLFTETLANGDFRSDSSDEPAELNFDSCDYRF